MSSELLLAMTGSQAPPAPVGLTSTSVFTLRTSGTAVTLRAACWSDDAGLFVVVGDSGTILTSPDGVTWTSRVSGTTNAFQNVVAANGIIMGGAGSNIYRSTDGITWSAVALGATSMQLHYSAGLGLWLASSGGSVLRKSADNGLTWTSTATLGFSGRGVTASATRIWVTGQSGNSKYSDDGGTTWVVFDEGVGGGSSSDYMFYAPTSGMVFNARDAQVLMQSPNGNTGTFTNASATQRTVALGNSYDQMDEGANGQLLFLGGTGKVFFSDNNASTWTQLNVTATTMQGIAYGDSKVVVCGGSGRIYST